MTGSWNTYESSSTEVRIPSCPACGCLPHNGGIGACPEVQEVEYDACGLVKRFVKRPHSFPSVPTGEQPSGYVRDWS